MSKSNVAVEENVANVAKAAGTITIEFTSNVSKKVLEDEFANFFTKFGTVELTNMNGKETELTIHEHKFTYFDEESEVTGEWE